MTPTAHSRGAATPLTDAQIDYAIGRRVMKWGVSGVHGQPAWNIPIDDKRGRVIYQSEWRPSTSIADAWKVLEQFKWGEWDVNLHKSMGGWMCRITRNGTALPYIEADTAPRAICLACLAVMQVQS